MPQHCKIFSLFLSITILCTNALHAQVLTDKPVQLSVPPTVDSSATAVVHSITISGNKKTKEYIIRREMQFKEGDGITIAALRSELIKARQQVYNTTLFTEVKIDAVLSEQNSVTLIVSVKERWYIYPLPQFQLVDRNFNEWLKLHNGDLNRVNYGSKFTHYDLTGRRDQLAVSLLNGYSRNISFAYTEPYSNRALTEGFSIAAGYSQNREIAYQTDHNNKLLFFPADTVVKSSGNFVRNSFTASGSYIIRKGFFKKQLITLAYFNLSVADSVISGKYNPGYFNSTDPHQSFFDVSYAYQYTNVNNVGYPLRGVVSFINATKRGFGFSDNINMLQLETGYSKYIPFGKKWYGVFQAYVKIKLPFEQAYINQRGLGYGDVYVRGLEYYVIDGVMATLAKATVKKKLFSFNLPLPFKTKILKTIPFTFYAKTFGDLGYVYNKDDRRSYLNDRLLYSYGFGVDIVTLYDISFRLEYSFNQLAQNGLFLHTKGGF